MRIGFCGLLAIVFITLKLTNFIDWSWWWVLSPVWGGAILWVLLLLILAAIEILTESRRLEEVRKENARRNNQPYP